MFPEESRLRRELARRTFRSGEDVWLAMRRELLLERPRRAARAWAAVLAVGSVLVLVAVLRGRPESVERRLPEDFDVTNVRSLGRPATPIVLQPDPKTVIVVVN